MDFKRIEWIFFLAFLGVNIFLFTIYREAKSEQNVVFRSNQTIPIERRLASENIKTHGKFSKASLEGYYLSGEPTDMKTALDQQRTALNNPLLLANDTVIENNALVHVVSDDTYISDSKRTGDVLRTYLDQTDKVLFGSEYVYIPEWTVNDGDQSNIFAAQAYEGVPINDESSRLDLSLEKDGDLDEFVRYTQTHVAQLTPLREAMQLYSEEDAVNTLYVNNKIPSNSTLKWQQLAYTLTLKVRGKNVYVPAWFVAIEGPDNSLQIERVNAITNRIITSSTVRSVENT